MIGNLLSLAQGLLGVQSVQWYKFLSRAENAAGYQVATYAQPQDLDATVQPVSEKMYQLLGLDWNKQYVTVYTSSDLVAVARDGSGDKVVSGGVSYLCESVTDWKAAQAGWRYLLASRVPA